MPSNAYALTGQKQEPYMEIIQSLYGAMEKKCHIHCVCFSVSKQYATEGTLLTQMCQWRRSDFTLYSGVLGQAVRRTYISLLLFLLYYAWPQVGKESIPNRSPCCNLLEELTSSWCKKPLWPNPLMKSTPVTEWKQEEKQVEGLLLPHTSKCNLYLFHFPVLTPPTLPRSRLLLGNLTSLLHRCCAVLLPRRGLLLCSRVGKNHIRWCFQQSASRDTASSSVLGSR